VSETPHPIPDLLDTASASCFPAELLRGIAHDMRAPLSGALALIEMLESGADGALAPSQVARLRRVRQQLERLGRLAAQVSELAVIESGRSLPITGPVDIPAAFAAARQSLFPVLRARAMELQLTIPEGLPRALADEKRLHQALAALVGWATRATSSTGLELRAEHSAGTIQILLRETHRGVPVEALEAQAHVDPGQADPVQAAEILLDLTGIATARSLISLVGGELSWRPDSAQDTVAVVTLPAEPVVSGEASRSPDRLRESPRQIS